MKKLLLLTAATLFGLIGKAQPWLNGINMNKPVKLQDITEAYERIHEADETNDEPGTGDATEVEEDKDYHYQRWVWYWERHLDPDGYLVSPLKNFVEARGFEKKKPQAKTTAVDQSQWTFAGPDNSTGIGNTGLGRINVVSFHPTDSNTFWIGSAGGGAWKTSNGGLNWTAINDDLPVLGVSDIDFNPLNPNTVYMCMGDRDAKDNYSVGVLKSYDGGASWDTTGLKWIASEMRIASSLVINPVDTNSLTLAASDGMYKSYDGGATWAKTATGEFKQVVYHPTDTAILYAVNTMNIFRSNDGGATWQQKTSFTSNVSRLLVAVTPAAPNLVKAVVANASYGLEGIYRSGDTGTTFTKIFTDGTNCNTNILASTPKGNACGGQGWYDLTIAINPVDSSKMVVGGVNTWYSANGGYNWQLSNQWNNSQAGIKVIHADKHYHAYNPLTPQTLYECNDGGIYRSYSPATTSLWTNLTNGLGITQFYRNAVSDDAAFVIGGAQDNGTKRLTGTTYAELYSGDGMECQIDYFDSKVFYVATQNGEIYRTTNNGSNFTNISNNITGNPAGAWVTPYVLDPADPNTIYAGFNKLYKSDDRGSNWTAVSNSYGSNINRIAVSMFHPEKIYIVANNSIYYTLNSGTNWKGLSKPFAGTISDIQVDPRTERLWVSCNGYGTTRVAEYDSVWGWTQRNEQLPDVPVNCIAIDSSNGTVYIGTDIGVYYRDYNVIEWVPFDNGMPTVEVMDLGINYKTNEIYAATYGRGMWKSPAHDPTQTTAIHHIPLANNIITISPNPSTGNFGINTGNKALQGSLATVRILNMAGAVVWQNSVSIDAGGNATINTDLPRGSYVVEVSKNNMMFAREKVIIR